MNFISKTRDIGEGTEFDMTVIGSGWRGCCGGAIEVVNEAFDEYGGKAVGF